MVDGSPCAFRFFSNRRQRSPDHDQDDLGHMTPSIEHNLLLTVRSGYPFVRTFVDLHARGNPSTMVPARKHWIRLARDHRCVDLQFSLHFVSKFCATCSSNGPHLSAEQASRDWGGGCKATDPGSRCRTKGSECSNVAVDAVCTELFGYSSILFQPAAKQPKSRARLFGPSDPFSRP